MVFTTYQDCIFHEILEKNQECIVNLSNKILSQIQDQKTLVNKKECGYFLGKRKSIQLECLRAGLHVSKIHTCNLLIIF